MSVGSASVLALADDLSGAAETAAVLMSHAGSALIALSGPPYPAQAPVLVADLDSRHHPQTFDLVREALRHAGRRRVFVKIDSLLRGNIAATVAACLDTAPVVLAPSLPSAGRTVTGGVPYVRGVLLRETRTWRVTPTLATGTFAQPAPITPTGAIAQSAPATVEGAVPEPAPSTADCPVTEPPSATAAGTSAADLTGPATVADALGAMPSVLVPLSIVRAGHRILTTAITEARGRVAVCDAETDGDLDAIVAAALDADPSTHLIGAGGLAAAVGRTLSLDPPPSPHDDPPPDQFPGPPSNPPPDPPPDAPASRPSASPLLVVVGTAEPGAAEQAALLVRHGVTPIPLTAADLNEPEAAARRVRDVLARHVPAVLTMVGPAPPALTATLGGVVARAIGDQPAGLVLTGGETARRVLDALGVTELTPLGQIHHGAVLSQTPQGHHVVTRPGSFGERDSLLRIAAHLAPHHFTSAERLT
ncbi:four-carbon acid sugar kinase family protein [Nonomuraea sp. NPDC048892]|uniref:four-carbon acid sugar kinase family protein n=1 Tax=Nonomuraea sp. NPDC048892 TaxID=3154624 RepID=UPI0034089485